MQATAPDRRATVAENPVLQTILFQQRTAYAQERCPSAPQRIDRLRRMLTLLRGNTDAIEEAISADFGNRSRDETLAYEVLTCVGEIKHAIKHLPTWMKRERRAVPLLEWPARAEVIRQPLGVVGVIAPWNYPLYLAVSPIVGALGAGNRVMAKLSELTPSFAALFADLVAKNFDQSELFIVNGGPEVAREFSALPFDHLLFTGSTAVGREVMRAAAPNLTPVTLELGGKSPTLIDDDVDLPKVTEQVLFAKLGNAGQTCVSPDYVLLPRVQLPAFLAAARAAVQSFYPRLQGNTDYTSVVNDRHAARLLNYLEDAQARGATLHPLHDEPSRTGSRQLVPVAITQVDDSMRVMQEEIFGPLLPIVLYDQLQEAIDYINAHPRPLALYMYSRNRDRIEQVLRDTVSGGVTINGAMGHVGQHDLPFGGVGPSGMGHYHGREGFDTFSKCKGVLHQSARRNPAAMAYPPRTNGKLRRLAKFMIGR